MRQKLHFFVYVCIMNLSIITYRSPDYHKMLALRYKVLREPWGLNFSEFDLQWEKDDVFIVCCEAEQIIGCCILTRQNLEVVKLRQMAVHPDWQRKNIGTGIMAFAEQYAGTHRYSMITLHARITASGFYAKCGYAPVGDIFTEIGMAHIAMEKRLYIA